MFSKAQVVIRWAAKSVLGALALLPACSGTTGVSDSIESPAGTLELGMRSSLAGVRYQLEASFTISGADSAALAARAGEAILSLELAPGSYAIQLQPGYRVYQDQAVVLTPIDAELLSDEAQAFEIAAAVTTRVSYRFVTAAGALTFGADERE